MKSSRFVIEAVDTRPNFAGRISRCSYATKPAAIGAARALATHASVMLRDTKRQQYVPFSRFAPMSRDYIEEQQRLAFARRCNRHTNDARAPWRELKNLHDDALAFRAHILRREGWETLHNIIRGEHGLPNRY